MSATHPSTTFPAPKHTTTLIRAANYRQVEIARIYTCVSIPNPNLKMHPLNLVLFTIFGSSFAATIIVENLSFGDGVSTQIGNTNCSRDIYKYRNNYCDGDAYMHLGDILPPGCPPLDGDREWVSNTAAGFCVNINGDIALDPDAPPTQEAARAPTMVPSRPRREPMVEPTAHPAS